MKKIEQIENDALKEHLLKNWMTHEPAVHVRIHPGTPEWFFHKSVELLQLGISRPLGM
jgi:pyruvate-formate lyase